MMPSNAHQSSPAVNYRPDIDGLRAIAILAVLFYHIFPELSPGGFVGVDIFFVISGYLISRIIMNDLNAGNFSFWNFYKRRVKRIFPALIFVLLASALIGWAVLFEYEYEPLGKHIAASSAFILNFVLWRETGYFEPAANLKPLLHLWSLSVEEQYYVIWPFLLWLAYKKNIQILFLVLIGGALSFLINVQGASHHSLASFYLIPARFWEFLVGCALACKMPLWGQQIGLRSKQPSSPLHWLLLPVVKTATSNLLAVLGLIIIIVAIFFLDKNMRYPGWWALLPTAGTFLLIATGPSSIINSKLLGNRLFIFIGLISYPLYLWHWPLLTFAKITLIDLTFSVKSGVIVLSLILAWATYEFIEKPIRFGKSNQQLKTGLAIVLLAVTAAVGGLVYQKIIHPRLFYATLQITEANRDWDYPDNGGIIDKKNVMPSRIQGDDASGILLIGDSHIKQYWSRFKHLNEQDKSLGAVTFAPLPCPSLPNIVRIAEGEACHLLFDQAMELANDKDIKRVVFGGYWEAYIIGHFGYKEKNYVPDIADYRDPHKAPLYIDGAGFKKIFAEFKTTIEMLIKSGKKVTIILSNPTSPVYEPGSFVSSRLSVRVKFGEDPFILKRDYVAFVAPIGDMLRRLAEETGAEIIDPVQYLCSEEKCYVTASGSPIYKDDNHLRASYVREHATFLDSLYVK